MIDIEATWTSFLRSKTAFVPMIGTRLFIDSRLPSGYTLEQGPAILSSIRGGDTDNTSKIFYPSFSVRCYGSTMKIARQLSRLVFDELQDKSSGAIRRCYLASGTIPTPIHDQETDWPYILMFFDTIIANEV